MSGSQIAAVARPRLGCVAAVAAGVLIAVHAFPRGLIVVALLGIAVGRRLVRGRRAAAAADRSAPRRSLVALGRLDLADARRPPRRRAGPDRSLRRSARSAAAASPSGPSADLEPVAPPAHPVLFFNPRSGGGKAERFALADEAARARHRAVELRAGDDLETLVRDAVADGADALAMAGGDGSQAIVAAVAAEHDLPYACIPAGTRNHFALRPRRRPRRRRRRPRRLRRRRRAPRRSRRGQRPRLRQQRLARPLRRGRPARGLPRGEDPDAARRRVPEMRRPAGHRARPAWAGPGGHEHHSGVAILVSNNRYRLGRAVGSGTRPRIDDGLLGVTVVGAPRGRGGGSPAAAPVARMERARVRGRRRPPGPGRDRRRGGDARAAAALPDPPGRPAGADRPAAIPAPRRRRRCPSTPSRASRRSGGSRPAPAPSSRTSTRHGLSPEIIVRCRRW